MEIDTTGELELTQYRRTPDDVRAVIKLAKLNEKHLTDVTQAIYYSSNEDDRSNNFKLLELNSHLLSVIEEGQTISFKGGLDEKVVLCTNDKTYEVKEAGTSNSVLLVPDLKMGQATSVFPLKSPKGAANRSLDRSTDSNNDSSENIDVDMESGPDRELEQRYVVKVFHEYFECREIQPRFRKLNDILQLTRYSGPENEFCINRSMLFTRKQLLDTIQCSCNEFEKGLTQNRAIEIAARIRVLDVEYEYRILSYMLNLITENSWPLNAIDREETTAAIGAGIAPEEVVEGLFDLYTFISAEQPAGPSTKLLYTYRQDMICRTIAQNILQQGTKFHLEDFMQTWQDSLPEGVNIDEKYLRGIGVVDRGSGSVPCVRSLIESHLSTNLLERLSVLFKTKERWTLEQIQPYIEYFTTPQLTVTSILAKHARSMTDNGQRIYVSKHGL